MLNSTRAHPSCFDLDFEGFVDEQSVIDVHSKSFSLAAKLLPQNIQDDVCKLYAWCRWCDNAVDEAPSYGIAKARLAALRTDIERIYANKQVNLPASNWLAELVAKYDLPKRLPLDLLLGMESDLDFEPIRNEHELDLYCYRVAGVVGLMMCRLLDVTDTRAHENANRLGIAMQLTNIARDISEDWDRGRCYLPSDWIELDPKHDKRPTDEQVNACVRRLLERAEHNYEMGYHGYPYLPGRTRIAIRVAAAIYREIGQQIKRHDFRVMGRRHIVPNRKKIALICRQLGGEVCFRTKICWKSFTRSMTEKSNQYNDTFSSIALKGVDNMNSQFHFLAIFGLSMTLIMATVLFALMGMNPKLASYSLMPWAYSGMSAIGATVLWFWSKNIGKKLDETLAKQRVASHQRI